MQAPGVREEGSANTPSPFQQRYLCNVTTKKYALIISKSNSLHRHLTFCVATQETVQLTFIFHVAPLTKRSALMEYAAPTPLIDQLSANIHGLPVVGGAVGFAFGAVSRVFDRCRDSNIALVRNTADTVQSALHGQGEHPFLFFCLATLVSNFHLISPVATSVETILASGLSRVDRTRATVSDATTRVSNAASATRASVQAVADHAVDTTFATIAAATARTRTTVSAISGAVASTRATVTSAAELTIHAFASVTPASVVAAASNAVPTVLEHMPTAGDVAALPRRAMDAAASTAAWVNFYSFKSSTFRPSLPRCSPDARPPPPSNMKSAVFPPSCATMSSVLPRSRCSFAFLHPCLFFSGTCLLMVSPVLPSVLTH